MKPLTISMTLLFYNEEENVVRVLSKTEDALKRANCAYEIIAVDDGSSDNTGMEIDSYMRKSTRVKKVHVPVNQGYGWGVIQGLKNANGDYIGYGGGDLEVDPTILEKLVDQIRKEKPDLIKITRTHRKDGLKRKWITQVYNKAVRLLFPINSEDANGSPKLLRRARYGELNLQSKDWFIDLELMIKASQRNYKIIEVPVTHKKRAHGSSSVNVWTIFEFAKNMVWYAITRPWKGDIQQK